MIKLSAVKVRLQYRTRVRYRLLVLEYAWEQGPVAAGRHYGLSARTIRRWRKRWRQGGLEALVPSYPRHRARRVSPPAVELIDPPRPPGARLRSGARPALAAARARDPARDGYDSAGLSRRGPAPPPADPQAGTDRRPLGVSVHRPRRLHALPRPAALSAFGPSLEPRLPGLRRAFPFPIKRLQCDHGQEFSFAFGLGVEAAGIRHRYIGPAGRNRTAKSNAAIGSIRRSSGAGNASRTSSHSCPSGLGDPIQLCARLLALQGRTPAEKLAALQPPRGVA